MQDDLAEKIRAALIIVQRAMAQIEALPLHPHHALTGLSLRGMAETLALERRMRAEHFPPALFGEPAWDLMLALFVAREDGRSFTLADACLAARVSPRAGRRLLETMQLEGLVEPVTAQRDRQGVRLTAFAAERLSAYLLACSGKRLSG